MMLSSAQPTKNCVRSMLKWTPRGRAQVSNSSMTSLVLPSMTVMVLLFSLVM
jgi:hypothetical protein